MRAGVDVVVIGGGVAGVAAALAAASRGRQVVLVRAGPGASAVTTGAWRGPLPDALCAALAAAGLPHAAVPGPLPHPAGALHPADFAAAAQADARLQEGALVCGIAGLPGFHAPALAALWGEAAGVRLQAVELAPVGGLPPGGWSPASLAAALDRDPALLAVPLARAVRAAGAPCAILPAVLGLERSAEVRAALAAAAGVPVGEALGTPPSIPGWRLDAALRAIPRRAGVDVVAGRVVRCEVADRRVLSVVVRPAGATQAQTGADADGTPGGERELAADAFVLATGKYLAGGLEAAPRFREPALGCPAGAVRGGRWFAVAEPLALTRPERGEAQPLLAAGVATDAEGRPVDAALDVVYGNVRVAGSIRAGVETAALGLGHAAEEGWRAGLRAAGEVP